MSRASVVLPVSLLLLSVLPAIVFAATDAGDPGRATGDSAGWGFVPVSGLTQLGPAMADGTPARSLSFNGFRFDPVQMSPDLPPVMAIPTGLTLVQFEDVISAADRQAVGDAGATILWYLPQNAYLVAAPGSAADALAGIPGVRWTGPWVNGYALSPELRDRVFAFLTDTDAADLSQPVDLLLMTVGPSDPVVDAVHRVGGSVRVVDPMYVHATVQAGWLLDLSLTPEIGNIQPYHPPALLNDNGGRIIHVRQTNNGPFTNPGDALWSWNNYDYPGLANGTGITVADADTGVDGTHPNFPSWKKVWYSSYGAGMSDWSDCNGHGTHTSGSAVGLGLYRGGPNPGDGTYIGMAPGAKLVGQAILCGGGSSYYAYTNDAVRNGATITTNSWGAAGVYGDYDGGAAAYDTYTRDADNALGGDQPILVIFAAGNDGPNAKTIGPPGTGKNMIVVGASGDNKGGLASNQVAGFSSRGPTDDGRMKPDLVAPGHQITSSWRGATSFTAASGTSMSTPIVAGGAAVLQSYWLSTKGVVPSPALTKALLINGADPLAGYTYPGNTQGWGLINVAKSVLETANRKIVPFEQNTMVRVQTGDYQIYAATVTAGTEFRTTLTWSDIPGASNNPIPSLVNDLDLIVIDPSGNRYLGNRYSGSVSATGCVPDVLNNVEGARFTNPAAGTWQIMVAGRNVPIGPQDFALVVTGNVAVGAPVKRTLDLSARDISAPKTAFEGGTITIDGNVTNLGDLTVPGVDWIIVHNETEEIARGTIASLAGGQVEPVTASWPAVRGFGHRFTLAVDPQACWPEVRRDNNNRTAKVDVLYYAQKLTATKTTLEGRPGQQVTFSFQAENAGTAPDTYNLTTTMPAGNWTADLTPATASPVPGGKATVQLGIVAPDDAVAGSRVPFTVSMASQSTGMRSTSTVTLLVLQNGGLGLEVYPVEQEVIPGARGTFLLNVTNTGNGRDTFTIAVTGIPSGWSEVLSNDAPILEPFAAEQVALDVGPLPTVRAGDRAIISVSIASTFDPTLIREVQVTAIAAAVHRVAVTIEPQSSQSLPGGTLDYAIHVANTGNAGETLSFKGRLPDENWTGEFDNDEVIIDPGETLDMVYAVKVPAGALAGSGSVEIEWNDTRLDHPEAFDVEVLAVRGFTLTPATSSVDFNTPKTGEAIFTVTNTGNAPDTFLLEISKSAVGVKGILSNDKVTLTPGDSAKVRATITSTATQSVSVQLALHAQSKAAPEIVQQATIKVTVTVPAPVVQKPKPNPFQTTPADDTTPGALTVSSGLLAAMVGIIIAAVVALLIVRAIRQRKPPTQFPPPSGPPLQSQGPGVVGTQSLGETVGGHAGYGEIVAAPAYEPIGQPTLPWHGPGPGASGPAAPPQQQLPAAPAPPVKSPPLVSHAALSPEDSFTELPYGQNGPAGPYGGPPQQSQHAPGGPPGISPASPPGRPPAP